MWQLGPDSDSAEWRVVDTDFETNLHAVVDTVDGPYAVGEGGTIVAKRDGNEDWEVIYDQGPATRDNMLTGLDVTDDGERIWFLGSSGAMGCYDVETQKKFDYSFPDEKTSTWEGIAVAGDRGEERGLAANGSGEVIPFEIHGFEPNFGPTTDLAGEGASIAGIAGTPEGTGYAVDTSGNVFKTSEGGWERIGIRNAQVRFYDVYAEGDHVYVAAGDGRIYRYDNSYADWTPIGLTDRISLRAFDRTNGNMVVVGDEGHIFERDRDDDSRWIELHSPTEETLFDVALGATDVAVGEGGVIIARPEDGWHDEDETFTGRGKAHSGEGSDEGSGEGSHDDEGADDGESAEDGETESCEHDGSETEAEGSPEASS